MGHENDRHELLEPLLVKPPIVVIDGVTADLFESVAHAERYLEPPDIEGLLIFDADGSRFEAHVVEDDVPVFFSLTTKRPRVVIRPIEPPLIERERMEDLLRQCLQGASTKSSPDGDVIDLAIRVLGFTA